MVHFGPVHSEDFVESSLNPDYLFRCKKTNKEFYVEAKFRSSTFDGKFEWCNYKQLKRYKKVNEDKITFLMLGIGGTPKEPKNISLIPLDELEFTGLFPSFVNKFVIDSNEPFPNEDLWKLTAR